MTTTIPHLKKLKSMPGSWVWISQRILSCSTSPKKVSKRLFLNLGSLVSLQARRCTTTISQQSNCRRSILVMTTTGSCILKRNSLGKKRIRTRSEWSRSNSSRKLRSNRRWSSSRRYSSRSRKATSASFTMLKLLHRWRLSSSCQFLEETACTWIRCFSRILLKYQLLLLTNWCSSRLRTSWKSSRRWRSNMKEPRGMSSETSSKTRETWNWSCKQMLKEILML